MKRIARMVSIVWGVCVLASAGLAAQEEHGLDLADGEAMKRLEIQGLVSVDKSLDSGDGSGSLKVSPAARVVWPLRPEDGAGLVRFKVYDDGAAPADPKKRHAGPHWGVIDSQGRILAAGAIYAPYLNGAETYACSAYTPGKKGDSYLAAVQYLGIRRKPGWHEWAFDFDAEKGLRILYEGQDVNARRERFDWAKAKFQGFSGIAILGDGAKSGGQTIWVDALSATTSGAMTATPPTPTPVPAIVPESDPAPEKAVRLVDAVRGKHPRLLFGPDEVAGLRERAKKGAPFFDEMVGYVGASDPPRDPKFQSNATDAQRQGLWRLPTLALHYLVAGDAASLKKAEGFLRLFLRLEHWETGKEADSGMGAANILSGAALAYDWLYDDLEADLRRSLGEKLLLQARRQYYGGHLKRNPGPHYWQSDPQNNHRYHRDSGLALAVLAVADEVEGAEWILAQTAEELAFLHKWLPEDGTSHESPTYQTFGLPYLAMAMTASDRCLGTEYLQHAYFRQAPVFQLQSFTPGFQKLFSYGDSDVGGISGYTVALLACTSAHGLKDAQDGLMQLFAARPKGAFPTWMGFLWHDASLSGGALEKVSRFGYYPDMGIVYAREAWGQASPAAMFKCGPYGGHLLNAYSRANDNAYINVAHDDPDANTFLLYAGGDLIVRPDGYAKKKITAAHNTVLVDGKGQKGEGQHWTQPLRRVDMRDLAYMVSVHKSEGGRLVAEGEAGGMYDGLQGYRRAFVWMPGDYMLVFDRIVAKAGEPEIAWLLQSENVDILSEKRLRLAAASASVEIGFASATPARWKIVDSPAEHRGKPLGLKQLRLTAKTGEWVSAAVFDVWGRGVRVAVEKREGGATVRVEGAHGADLWQWRFGDSKAAMLEGASREGKALEWSPGAAQR